LGEHKEARKNFENAIKLDKNQPLNWFYGALNMDALNKRNGAMDGYKRYLKLNHDNAEMNAFAQARLEQLKQGRRFNWSKKLFEVFDTIKKETD
jgi:Tfp pilus assembly protein PilF